MSIRLGLALPQMTKFKIGRDVPLVARTAEETGYESLWTFERPLFPQPMTQGLYGVPGLAWPEHYRDVADPLLTLALAGAVTDRVRIGTSVLVASYHLPFQLAREFATLDNATGGRVVAGLGTGWSTDEHSAGAVAPIERRGDVLDELLGVLAAVWGPDPVSYQGEWTNIAPAEVGPKPATPIPVFLAAGNRRALRRVAERADGWMPVSGYGAQQLGADWKQLQDLAAEAGRERPVDIIARANVFYSAKPFDGADRMPFQGSVAQIVEDLAEHSAAVGGLPEVLFDLTPTVWDAQEMNDVASELYAAVRTAGI